MMEGNESRRKKKKKKPELSVASLSSLLRHSLLSGVPVTVLRYIKLIFLLNITLEEWGDVC